MNDMEKLTKFEMSVLLTIHEYLPYSFDEVVRVYENTKSYDRTIYILKTAIQLGTTPDVLCFAIYHDGMLTDNPIHIHH